MSTVMCTLPMVTPMVIGSSLITIAGLMRTLMPVLCPKDGYELDVLSQLECDCL
jgi:hypothetical protein